MRDAVRCKSYLSFFDVWNGFIKLECAENARLESDGVLNRAISSNLDALGLIINQRKRD